ncbi:MAG: 30S ribosomal protein S27e [Nanoarchaeota archaeon]|nr:30S ribosomal protein S27e [Nanoarchaeota archaeon]
MNGLVKEPKSRFIKVRCSKCKNEQIVFGKSSTKVHCLVCGKSLSAPTGGKTKLKARVLEVLE